MSSFSFGLYCESGIGKEIKIFKISTTSAEIIPLFNNRIPKIDPFLSNSKPTLDSCRIKKMLIHHQPVNSVFWLAEKTDFRKVVLLQNGRKSQIQVGVYGTFFQTTEKSALNKLHIRKPQFSILLIKCASKWNFRKH